MAGQQTAGKGTARRAACGVCGWSAVVTIPAGVGNAAEQAYQRHRLEQHRGGEYHYAEFAVVDEVLVALALATPKSAPSWFRGLQTKLAAAVVEIGGTVTRMTRADAYRLARRRFGPGTTLHEDAESVSILRRDPARRSRFNSTLLVVARGTDWAEACQRAGLTPTRAAEDAR